MKNAKQSLGKSGFTLVELLVVISIISLLIAVLLPALAKARKSAQDVQCLSNVKGLGTSIMAYTADNSDHIIPYRGPSDPFGQGAVVVYNIQFTSWMDHLHNNYINGQIQLMECPMQESKRSTSQYGNYLGGTGYRPFQPGYGINRYTMTSASSISGSNVNSAANAYPLRVADAIDAQEKVLLNDTGIGLLNGGHYPNLTRAISWAPIGGRWATNAQGGTSGLMPSDRHKSDKFYGIAKYPGDDFGGGSNFFFLDGHASFRKWMETAPWLRITANDTANGYNDGRTLFRTYWDVDGDKSE